MEDIATTLKIKKEFDRTILGVPPSGKRSNPPKMVLTETRFSIKIPKPFITIYEKWFCLTPRAHI
jgi:hypothetical protein